MSITFKRWGQSELLPRYIFAESIITHQRVLEIGAVASTGGMSAYFLLLKGARTVVACDNVSEAMQQAQARFGAPNLMFRPMVFEGLSPASFDLIAITDLAPFIKAPALFERLLRLLAPQGYVLGALRNTGGLALSQVMEMDPEEAPPSYGQLLDVLRPRFVSIQMATQAPVLGYQLAFEEGDGLQIEGSLAGAGEAAYYVVIAGKEPRKSVDPLWVQLPPEPLFLNRSKLEEAVLRARDWQTRFESQKEAFEKAKTQLGALEQENRHQVKQLNEAQEIATRLQMQAEVPLVDPSADLQLVEKVSQLSTDLAAAEGRANEAEARVSAMSMEIQRHVQALREATTDVLAAKESARIERTKREEAEAKAKEAVDRSSQVQEQAAPPQPLAADHMEFEKTKQELESQKLTIEALRRELELLREEHLRAVDKQKEALSELADKESLLVKLQEQERAVHLLQSDLCAMREERDALVFQLRMHSPPQEEGASEKALKEAAEESIQKGMAPEASAEELQKLNTQMRELEKKLSHKADEVDAMREDLALRSHSVERSKNRIRELESMLANAQTQSKEDNALLGAEYDKLKQDNVALRSMLEALRAKVETQKAEETSAGMHTAGTMLIALRKRYAEQEHVLTQTRKTLERTEGELEIVHKQLKELLKVREGANEVKPAKAKIAGAAGRAEQARHAEHEGDSAHTSDVIEPELIEIDEFELEEEK